LLGVLHEKNRLLHEPLTNGSLHSALLWMANALDPLVKLEEDNAVLAYLGGQRFLDST
jgi:hypothetical protein